MKIGIIGMGFVGKAVHSAIYNAFHQTVCIDNEPKKFIGTEYKVHGTDHYELLKDCDAVFVCVSSPSLPDGSCDTFNLEEVLYNLYNINYKNVIISKVTAPPNCYETQGRLNPNLVYIPEFLRESSAEKDFVNPNFIVVGGTIKAYQYEAIRVMESIIDLSCVSVHVCTMKEASLMKYTINCFLATKVTFMNQIYQIAKENDIDYEEVKRLIKFDHRIGTSHLDVPGPDGQFGFGGHCFPKDMKALISIQKDKKHSFLIDVMKHNLWDREKIDAGSI